MGYAWLNVGSLLFGMMALLIPIVNVIRQKKIDYKKLGILSSISIGACAIAICMQIFYVNHLVNIEDFSALIDTLSTIANVSMLLLLSTIILNTITYIVHS